MPIKTTGDDGLEVDVYTQAEVKEREDEIAKLKEDLRIASEKGGSFTALKTGMEAELKKRDDEISAMKKSSEEFMSKSISETRSEIISGLAGGDKDLATKIEAEFNGFAGAVSTKGEILERAKKAFNIVSPSTAPSAIDSFMSGTGGRGAITKQNPVVQETPEQADVRRKMGISDADFAKYNNQVK